MALGAAGWLLLTAAAAAAVDGLPASPARRSPPLRTERNGSFRANLSLSQRRWRQPKCERGGVEGGGGGEAEKEGFIHCLPLQCGGCGATPGTPSQSFSPSDSFHQDAARTSAGFFLRKVKRVPCFIPLFVWGVFLRSRGWAAAGCVHSPPPSLRIRARAITVLAEVTSLPHRR